MRGKKNNQIDYGALPSNLLVNLGKEALANASADGYVDYGRLPSNVIPEVGKRVLENIVKEESNK